MPLIRIEFDDAKVSTDEALTVSKALQKIVSEETGIKDVFVYTNTAQIKVQIAPIEAFVEMSAHKIDDLDTLFNKFKSRISAWREQINFPHRLNLTLIPMHWKFDTDI
jgi:hypothetical protein